MRSKTPSEINSILEVSDKNVSTLSTREGSPNFLINLTRFKFFYGLFLVTICLSFVFISLTSKNSISREDYLSPQINTTYYNSEDLTIYLGEGFLKQGFYVYDQNTSLYEILAFHENNIRPNPQITLSRKLIDGEVLSYETLGDISGKTPILEANMASLKSVSGIGDSTAEKILNYISAESPKNVDEILNVEGVGEKTVENLKELFY